MATFRPLARPAPPANTPRVDESATISSHRGRAGPRRDVPGSFFARCRSRFSLTATPAGESLRDADLAAVEADGRAQEPHHD